MARKENKGIYNNSGSEDMLGQTWTFTKRTPFAGEIIDSTNKRQIIEREARLYKEKNPEATAIECILWGRRYVNKEQKHFKSYLKGNNSYSYKGGKYLVEDMERKEVFERIGRELEQRFKDAQEKEEQNKIETIV